MSNKYGKPKLRKEVIEGAVTAYLLGKPLKVIAQRFDISMQSVINHVAKAGFKLRKKRRRP